MKTPQTNPELARLLALQVIPTRMTPLLRAEEEWPAGTASHDFLMLSARPDLSPELSVSTSAVIDTLR